MPEHKFHKHIGRLINNDNFKDVIIRKDSACTDNKDEYRNLPLFCSGNKSKSTEFCDADILIIKDNKVKVIIEIEESNVKPIQVCGKVFSASLADFYSYRNKESFKLSDKVIFIQILDDSRLPKGSYKPAQWLNLEKETRLRLPIGRIYDYKLFYGNVNRFDESLINYLKKVI